MYVYRVSIHLNMIRKIQYMNEEKEKKSWALSIGLYPGIVLGFRSYEQEDRTTHVAYIPFIDLALEVYHNIEEEE